MRARHRETAVMTDKPLAEAVIHQPRIANGTGKTMTAGAAQRQRRITAAIEKQQRLFLALNCDFDLFRKARRNEPATLRAFALEIDRLDLRHVLAAEA